MNKRETNTGGSSGPNKGRDCRYAGACYEEKQL